MIPLRIRWLREPGVQLTLLLILSLGLINAFALWGILAQGRDVKASAVQELQLQTTLQARALEAVLASRRGDFIFLSQSSPVADTPSILAATDPIMRRWGRLDVEGSLLLFLDAHPEVEHLVARDSSGKPLVVAARRDGAPVLQPPDLEPPPTSPPTGIVSGIWPLGPVEEQRGTLEAIFSLERLLEMAVPGAAVQLSVEPAKGEFEPSRVITIGDELIISSEVRDDAWNPPIHWVLTRREDSVRIIESFSALAGRYRTSVILNALVMALALVVGLVGVRQIRRSVALEAEYAQQARIRELERQVLHNERLASVGRLAGGMAHEINNPLEGMSNYLTLLEDDIRSGQTAELPSLVAQIRKGLDRTAAVIRQVLAFSDPGEAPHRPVRLDEVLRETLDFLCGHPSFRHLEIHMSRSSDEDVWVRGNRITLGQLFLNLVLNACQLQPDRGEVEVQVSGNSDHVVVEVADRGPGIPEAAISRIFEPFFSGRGSTGLGLSVCHGIALNHGGSIEARNRQGGGAVFRVTLPRQDQPLEEESSMRSHAIRQA